MHGFSGPLGLKWGFGRAKWGRDDAMLTASKLLFTFGGTYVCANFGENLSRNATVRVLADGRTGRRKPILSHAICYGTDNKNRTSTPVQVGYDKVGTAEFLEECVGSQKFLKAAVY